MPEWPAWWSWELEFSPHLFKRMLDRQFSETDLRQMLESADAYDRDVEPGRWAVRTRHDGGRWEVIVEPLESEHVLLVITAYDIKP
jgi:hypothetical protein